MIPESTLDYESLHPMPVYRLERCDGSRLCFQDRMIYDLLEIFQPKVTKVIYQGHLYIDGEEVT